MSSITINRPSLGKDGRAQWAGVVWLRRSATTFSQGTGGLLSLAFLGGLIGVAVAIGDAGILWMETGDCRGDTRFGSTYTGAHCDFVENPQSVIWFAVVGMQAALLGALARPIRRTLKELASEGQTDGALGAVTVLTMLVLAPSAVLWGLLVEARPLPAQTAKMSVLVLLVAGVALAGAVGILRVERLVRGLVHDSAGDRGDLVRYLRLREVLQRLLSIEGAILASAILASAAFRNAVAATGADAARDFPIEYVLVYGAYFSAVLALIYAPTYLRLQALGATLRDQFVDLSDPADARWSDRYAKWKDLGELLRLETTVIESFRGGVAIVAPLGTSVVGALLGG